MQNNIIKKGFVVGIIVLFVGAANHLVAFSIDVDMTSNINNVSFIEPCLLEGWPITIDNISSSPVTYDFNNDGKNEIVISTCISGAKIYVINSDGTIASGWPVALSYSALENPVVGDLDNDGIPEIVTHNGRIIYVLHPDGSIVWEKESDYSLYMGPVLVDLDGDRCLEILLTTCQGMIFVLSYDGTEGWRWNNPTEGAFSTPAVCDLDMDGNIEIVFNTRENKTYVLNHNGTIASGWPITIPNIYDWFVNLVRPPVIADLDGDGDFEIVRDGGTMLYVLENDGSIASGWPQSIEKGGNNAFCLGDIDSDDLPEIVFARNGGDLGYLYAFNGDGSSVPGWPIITDYLYTACVMGDVDSSLSREIIVRSENKIAFYKSDGTFYTAMAINDAFHSATTNPSPLITDLDGDGYVDIVAPSFYNQIYAWTFPGIYELSKIEWPMFQHDPCQSGLYLPMNKPPNAPNINGPTSGKIGEEYEYTFATNDPEGDDVTYFVDWDDGTISGWTVFVASGAELVLNHKWQKRGTYNIKARAKDSCLYGAESFWSNTLTVTMRRNKITYNTMFLSFLEQFPILSRLFQRLGLQ